MARKYIKGKDGKFKGSYPDGRNAPSSFSDKVLEQVRSVPNPYAPVSPPEGLDIESAYEEFMAQKAEAPTSVSAWAQETGGSVLFMKPEYSQDYAATVTLTADNKVEAIISVKTVDDREDTLDSKTFADPAEAEEWAKKALDKRIDVVAEFDWHYAADREDFTFNIDRHVAVTSNWTEQIDTTFGPPTGWMRCDKRGATVQRLGASGYLVRVHDYRSAFDEEGEMFTERHLPDFDKAWAFAKFTCALTNRDK